VIGGKKPVLDAIKFSAMGLGLVMYASAAMLGAVRGSTLALTEAIAVRAVASFAERWRLLEKNLFGQLDTRVAAHG
jgi:hypothetical protein